MDSILTSVKKMLGITEQCEDFDVDIIMHINTTLQILCQLGAINESGFTIEDKGASWDDLLGDNKNVEAIKSYIYMKVRLMFDPPTSSAHIEALKSTINELEWRLSIVETNNAGEEES